MYSQRARLSIALTIKNSTGVLWACMCRSEEVYSDTFFFVNICGSPG